MKNKLFITFLVILVSVLMPACGQFLGVGSSSTRAAMEGTREAGTGFDSGKAISETQDSRYTIEHRLNVDPQDGYTESTHYGLQPGH